MPIKFPEINTYSINYEHLFSTFMYHSESKLFQSKINRHNYFKQWITYLSDADHNLIKELDTIPELRSKYKDYYLNKEMFYQPYFYGKQTILTHFNIDFLKNNFPIFNTEPIKFIDTNEFLRNNSMFHWSPESDKALLKNLKNSPIFSVPILDGSTKYLIVDGNKRLTDWVTHKSEIPVLFFNRDFLINSNAFCSDFDKLHYIFCYDLINLLDISLKQEISDSELLTHSYLPKLDKILYTHI